VNDALALIVCSLVEVLDTLVSTLSNTATFIRLAAFALGHAGLFLATFTVADAVAKTGGGTVGAMVVVIAGNVVIIALEGLIVSVQSIRLEYYEFFSKFYSAGGEEYRPLRFAAAAPQR
jgi:V/A-type H+-transporting ATPase subunit I